MMQPSRSMGKEESPLGGCNEKPAFVQKERYPDGSEDADSVYGNEVRDASVDEKAGVIDVG
jgi:hypothetical protein